MVQDLLDRFYALLADVDRIGFPGLEVGPADGFGAGDPARDIRRLMIKKAHLVLSLRRMHLAGPEESKRPAAVGPVEVEDRLPQDELSALVLEPAPEGELKAHPVLLPSNEVVTARPPLVEPEKEMEVICIHPTPILFPGVARQGHIVKPRLGGTRASCQAILRKARLHFPGEFSPQPLIALKTLLPLQVLFEVKRYFPFFHEVLIALAWPNPGRSFEAWIIRRSRRGEEGYQQRGRWDSFQKLHHGSPLRLIGRMAGIPGYPPGKMVTRWR